MPFRFGPMELIILVVVVIIIILVTRRTPKFLKRASNSPQETTPQEASPSKSFKARFVSLGGFAVIFAFITVVSLIATAIEEWGVSAIGAIGAVVFAFLLYSSYKDKEALKFLDGVVQFVIGLVGVAVIVGLIWVMVQGQGDESDYCPRCQPSLDQYIERQLPSGLPPPTD